MLFSSYVRFVKKKLNNVAIVLVEALYTIINFNKVENMSALSDLDGLDHWPSQHLKRASRTNTKLDAKHSQKDK